MSIEIEDGRAWFFEIRSCGEPPETPVYLVLRWILEQLHLGCAQLQRDESGDAVTLTLGKDAAPSFPEPIVERAIEYDRRRQSALDFARVFAQAREEGIEPRHVDLAETLRITATENAYMNTEFHYAFELVEVLQRIREKTFVFSSPPIKGPLPPPVTRLLGEATRAYLFRLNRSCVALCRSLLEAVLEDRLDGASVLEERLRTKRGELECMINVGFKQALFTKGEMAQAHAVRKSGNSALHGDEPSDDEAWGVLLDTRRLIERLATSRGV